jgi:hypothetical protein
MHLANSLLSSLSAPAALRQMWSGSIKGNIGGYQAALSVYASFPHQGRAFQVLRFAHSLDPGLFAPFLSFNLTVGL